MNSRVEPEVICGAVVGDREQDRPSASSTVGSTRPSAAGLDDGEEAFASRASVNTISTWVEVSSADTMSAIHLRETRSSIDQYRHAGTGEVCRVVDPDWLGRYSTHSGHGLRTAAPGRGRRVQVRPWRENASHRRRRHPHPVQVGAAVGELAVRPVDLAPLVEQRHDLGHLVPEQAVHRAGPPGAWSARRPTGPGGDASASARSSPSSRCGAGTRPAASSRPSTVSSSRSSNPPWWPSRPGGRTRPVSPSPFSLDQDELDRQLLEGLDEPGRLGAGRLQLPSPAGRPYPGRDSASAASAPSLATVRIRRTVERSTSHWAVAASAIVTSCRTSCNQISYFFCDEVKNRLARAGPHGRCHGREQA